MSAVTTRGTPVARCGGICPQRWCHACFCRPILATAACGSWPSTRGLLGCVRTAILADTARERIGNVGPSSETRARLCQCGAGEGCDVRGHAFRENWARWPVFGNTSTVASVWGLCVVHCPPCILGRQEAPFLVRARDADLPRILDSFDHATFGEKGMVLEHCGRALVLEHGLTLFRLWAVTHFFARGVVVFVQQSRV